jgi:hypothetical protein
MSITDRGADTFKPIPELSFLPYGAGKSSGAVATSGSPAPAREPTPEPAPELLVWCLNSYPHRKSGVIQPMSGSMNDRGRLKRQSSDPSSTTARGVKLRARYAEESNLSVERRSALNVSVDGRMDLLITNQMLGLYACCAAVSAGHPPAQSSARPNAPGGFGCKRPGRLV